MKHTVAEAIDRFLDTVAPGRYSQVHLPKVRHQLLWWRECVGQYSLALLTPGVVVEALDQLRLGGVSPGTANRYQAALGSCLRAAQEWGWVDSVATLSVRRGKEAAARERFLTREEASRLLDEADKLGGALAQQIRFSLATGVRQGEMLSLRWADVDLAAKRARLRGTKSGRDRVIPLARPAVEALTEARRVQRLGQEVVWQGWPRSQWEAVREAAGLPDVRWHDLRHTAASWLAMSGATGPEIAAVLGHQTLSMVWRYTHFAEKHLGELAERAAEKHLG